MAHKLLYHSKPIQLLYQDSKYTNKPYIQYYFVLNVGHTGPNEGSKPILDLWWKIFSINKRLYFMNWSCFGINKVLDVKPLGPSFSISMFRLLPVVEYLYSFLFDSHIWSCFCLILILKLTAWNKKFGTFLELAFSPATFYGVRKGVSFISLPVVPNFKKQQSTLWF